MVSSINCRDVTLHYYAEHRIATVPHSTQPSHSHTGRRRYNVFMSLGMRKSILLGTFASKIYSFVQSREMTPLLVVKCYKKSRSRKGWIDLKVLRLITPIAEKWFCFDADFWLTAVSSWLFNRQTYERWTILIDTVSCEQTVNSCWALGKKYYFVKNNNNPWDIGL